MQTISQQIAEVRRRIERAEQRERHLESDSSFEANRQILIWLRSELEALGRRAA